MQNLDCPYDQKKLLTIPNSLYKLIFSNSYRFNLHNQDVNGHHETCRGALN